MSAAHTEGLLYAEKNAYNRVTLRSKDTDYPIATDLDDEEDARRLVACWNACDGLVTEFIEKKRPVYWIAERAALEPAEKLANELAVARTLLEEAIAKIDPDVDVHDKVVPRIRAFLKGQP